MGLDSASSQQAERPRRKQGKATDRARKGSFDNAATHRRLSVGSRAPPPGVTPLPLAALLSLRVPDLVRGNASSSGGGSGGSRGSLYIHQLEGCAAHRRRLVKQAHQVHVAHIAPLSAPMLLHVARLQVPVARHFKLLHVLRPAGETILATIVVATVQRRAAPFRLKARTLRR